jgi:hypothetical protein
MRIGLAARVFALSGALLAAAGVQATAEAQRSRAVDRTFVCAPRVFAGVRDLDLSAAPPQELAPSVGGGSTSAYLGVGSGSWHQRLVYVAARSGRLENERAGVYADARRCRAARARIPLSTKGLAGPPTRWRTDENCAVRGSVVVRVRATLQSPGAWQRSGTYAGVRRNVVGATIAVRDQKTGAPVALLRLDAKGNIALWSSARCS